MKENLEFSIIICGLFSIICVVNCVPTSVLLNNKKALESGTAAGADGQQALGSLPMGTNDDQGKGNTVTPLPPVQVETSSSNKNNINSPKMAPQKRGAINAQYFNELPNDDFTGYNHNMLPQPQSSAQLNGVWSDQPIIDSGVSYPDLYNNFDDYEPSSYRQQKAYDNLQRLLNSNSMYDDEEPFALPAIQMGSPPHHFQQPYPVSRYYPLNRNKRSNLNHIMRLKRQANEITTADMLALLAMIEANDEDKNPPQSLKFMDNDNSILDYPTKSFRASPSFYEQLLREQQHEQQPSQLSNSNNDDEGTWMNSYVDEPSVQYYGNLYNDYNPLNRPSMKNNKLYPSKRFMVSKKKRSAPAVGHKK